VSGAIVYLKKKCKLKIETDQIRTPISAWSVFPNDDDGLLLVEKPDVSSLQLPILLHFSTVCGPPEIE